MRYICWMLDIKYWIFNNDLHNVIGISMSTRVCQSYYILSQFVLVVFSTGIFVFMHGEAGQGYLANNKIFKE